MPSRSALLLPVALLLLAGCGSPFGAEGSSSAEVSASTASSSAGSPATASTPADSPSPTAVGVTEDVDPNGDVVAQLKERFPGYPLLVDSSSLDDSFEMVKDSYNVGEQVVALIPGVYATYNESIPDLDSYYEAGVVFGDAMMHQEYLSNSGGSFFSGVQKSGQEPATTVPPAAEDLDSALATELKEQFPGYPVVVDLSSIDDSVAITMESMTDENKAVALVPGLYAAYNSHFTDPDKYYETSNVFGDQMMKEEYLPDTGGSIFPGIQAGSQEP